MPRGHIDLSGRDPPVASIRNLALTSAAMSHFAVLFASSLAKIRNLASSAAPSATGDDWSVGLLTGLAGHHATNDDRPFDLFGHDLSPGLLPGHNTPHNRP